MRDMNTAFYDFFRFDLTRVLKCVTAQYLALCTDRLCGAGPDLISRLPFWAFWRVRRFACKRMLSACSLSVLTLIVMVRVDPGASAQQPGVEAVVFVCCAVTPQSG